MTRYEDPGTGQTKVTETPDGLRLTFQQPMNLFSTLFLLFWLGGWYFGESSVVKNLLNPTSSSGGAKPFLLFWLAGWTLGGLFAVYTLLWQAAGSETAVVSASDMRLSKSLLGIPFTRKAYLLSDVKWLRVTDAPVYGRYGSRRDLYGLTFNYGLKTVMFFKGIDESEGHALCERMMASNVWLKALRAQPALDGNPA